MTVNLTECKHRFGFLCPFCAARLISQVDAEPLADNKRRIKFATTGKFLRSVAGVYVGTKGQYRKIVYTRLLELAKGADTKEVEITEAMVERAAKAHYETAYPGFDWERAIQHSPTLAANLRKFTHAALRAALKEEK